MRSPSSREGGHPRLREVTSARSAVGWRTVYAEGQWALSERSQPNHHGRHASSGRSPGSRTWFSDNREIWRNMYLSPFFGPPLLSVPSQPDASEARTGCARISVCPIVATDLQVCRSNSYDPASAGDHSVHGNSSCRASMPPFPNRLTSLFHDRAVLRVCSAERPPKFYSRLSLLYSLGPRPPDLCVRSNGRSSAIPRPNGQKTNLDRAGPRPLGPCDAMFGWARIGFSGRAVGQPIGTGVFG